ncbi:MAG: dihydroorotate dehydrogenase electron transfer subunit [Actinomycetota bacterium]
MTASISKAVVRSRCDVGEYKLLELEAPEIALRSAPGQFVSCAVNASGHILRRPFSILDAHDDVIEIGFDVVGAGTQWLASLHAKDELEVLGPLGTAFSVPTDDAVLIGGGYGAAPLLFLASAFPDVRTHLILGAATASRLFDPDRAQRVADRVTFTTEDGSRGQRGRVTDALESIDARSIYACGPMPMLAAVTKSAPRNARVEVAVEEFMGCGIGVCWTCVVPSHEEGYRKHIRSCIQGPVLDGRTIAWE